MIDQLLMEINVGEEVIPVIVEMAVVYLLIKDLRATKIGKRILLLARDGFESVLEQDKKTIAEYEAKTEKA